MDLEENPQRFGYVIRNLRLERRKTLAQIAEQLHVSVPYLSDVERGRRGILSLEQMRTLAEYLEADPVIILIAAVATTHSATVELPEDAHHDFQAALATILSWPMDTFYDPDAAARIKKAVDSVSLMLHSPKETIEDTNEDVPPM